jgi:hypothetical protein
MKGEIHKSTHTCAMTVNLESSPSPETYHLPPPSPEPSPGGRNSSKRSSNQACQADAVLVALMAGGKRPEIRRNDTLLMEKSVTRHAPAPGNVHKISKDRSKTGCIPCMARRIKCDEVKAICTYYSRLYV